MVKLRLRRRGRKKAPFYDIVAVDARRRRDGAFIERVGYYNPMTQPSTIVLDHDRSIYWLNVGAQPTDIVRSLLSYDGVLLRRQMQFKGKETAEISTAVDNHKQNALARYKRKKEQLSVKKAKAKEAKAAEAENTASE